MDVFHAADIAYAAFCIYVTDIDSDPFNGFVNIEEAEVIHQWASL